MARAEIGDSIKDGRIRGDDGTSSGGGRVENSVSVKRDNNVLGADSVHNGVSIKCDDSVLGVVCVQNGVGIKCDDNILGADSGCPCAGDNPKLQSVASDDGIDRLQHRPLVFDMTFGHDDYEVDDGGLATVDSDCPRVGDNPELPSAPFDDGTNRLQRRPLVHDVAVGDDVMPVDIATNVAPTSALCVDRSSAARRGRLVRLHSYGIRPGECAVGNPNEPPLDDD